jgi:ADP-ribose pyrophosphatase YjhB (NUDIX family)
VPGGVLDPGRDDDMDATATRILRDRTGLANVPCLAQVRVNGGRDRDPRGGSPSVLLCALLRLGAFRWRLRDDPSIEPIEGEFQGGTQRPAQRYRATRGAASERPASAWARSTCHPSGWC